MTYIFIKRFKMVYVCMFLMAIFFSESLYAVKTSDIKTRRISMISFRNSVLLDIVGPLTVFSAANMFISKKSGNEAYEIEILSEKKGPVRTFSGMKIISDNSYLNHSKKIDTLLIAGGPGVEKASKNQKLLKYLKRKNKKVRRLGSICGGSLILAKAGLLKGKKATTHWSDIEKLIQSYPDIKVKTDINFIRDGHIYTSGGVMNGVQLALGLVEEDYGIEVAMKVAKLLEVIYEH
ncbi:MAG: AraC family transcriptional regulator [Desulfobacterales bacterium]|nr:AraC family transcriptional regulator [Desulfobacterales bacterium]MCP4159077.1 AraC family transcriptional regulator [Deltaproteobacteria bacterium]